MSNTPIHRSCAKLIQVSPNTFSPQSTEKWSCLLLTCLKKSITSLSFSRYVTVWTNILLKKQLFVYHSDSIYIQLCYFTFITGCITYTYNNINTLNLMVLTTWILYVSNRIYSDIFMTTGRTWDIRYNIKWFYLHNVAVKEGRKLSKSKHNRLYSVFFIIRLTTCLGPCAGPSSGHKLCKEEKLYSVSHKMWYTIWNSKRSLWILDYIPHFMTHTL